MNRLTQTHLPVLSMAAAAVGFLGVQALAWLRAGGFEYPLDDVYIHLAMAEQIMNGTYGLNPGEPASAASSILYPLLLLPFPGTEFQRLLPFMWNGAAVLGLGWMFGHVLRLGGASGVYGAVLAIVAPFATNMPGVAFLGMEHTLHALVSLLLLVGLWNFLATRRLSGVASAALILGPLVRPEGFALSLFVAAVVFFSGHRRQAVLLAFAAVVPALAFGLFLTVIGLDPVPGSVLAKAGVEGHKFAPLLNLIINFLREGGVAVFAGLALVAVVAALMHRQRQDRQATVLLGVAAVVLAHLLAAQVGWLYRYEHYLMVLMGAALVLSCRQARAARAIVAVSALAAAAFYSSVVWNIVAWNSRSVLLQQAQMMRFTHELPGEPVALNDIGRVAWANDVRILDLWGLASAEARLLRRPADGSRPVRGWAADLIRNQAVRYAMIYDRWIGDGRGSDWVLVAHLDQRNPRGSLGEFRVSIYATDPGFVPDLRKAVHKFQTKLPADAVLIEDGQPNQTAGFAAGTYRQTAALAAQGTEEVLSR